MKHVINTPIIPNQPTKCLYRTALSKQGNFSKDLFQNNLSGRITSLVTDPCSTKKDITRPHMLAHIASVIRLYRFRAKGGGWQNKCV